MQPSTRNLAGAVDGALDERAQLAARDAILFEAQSPLVLVVGTDDLLLHANAATGAALGRGVAGLVGRPLAEAIPAASWRGRSVALSVSDAGGPRLFEGHAYDALPPSRNRILVFHDVSERAREDRALRDRHLRAQKLESLGALAGGIAHDFNDLLTPIVGNAGLLLTDLPERSPARRWAQAILDAGHRATELTTQMLAYAGRTDRKIASLDVSSLIEHVCLLLETTVSASSLLRYDLARGLPGVLADSGQITQIAVNLVANASAALGSEGGCIDVRTRRVCADRGLLDRCYLGDSRPEGEYVEIAVSNDGGGLAPEALEQLFDPFHATRITGRGLGLAVVLGAVQAHDGALGIDSSEAETCFRVLLPACAVVTAGASDERPREWPARRAASVNGLVLVVDGDDGPRETTTALLRRAGFDVLQASSGPQAVALFRRHAGEIAGVLLDGSLPGLSGAHVFERLQRIDPGVRVLVSGCAEPGAELRSRGAAAFLREPYEPDDLVDAIRRLLASN
jgi:nitrogen-specific signal transduction histidine kinase